MTVTPLIVAAARYERKEAGESLMSGPVKDLLEADDEDTLVATQQLIKMYDRAQRCRNYVY